MASIGLKQPRVIYFTRGIVPTDEEIAEAHRCGNNVVVRNAALVEPNLTNGQIERCDFVAGAVPPAYAKRFPNALTGQPATAPAAPAAPVGTEEGTQPAAAPPAWKPNT